MQGDKTIQADLHGKDAERECRAWLSMAENFQKAGSPDKAKEYLQKILDKYADTEWGAEAKKRMGAL